MSFVEQSKKRTQLISQKTGEISGKKKKGQTKEVIKPPVVAMSLRDLGLYVPAVYPFGIPSLDALGKSEKNANGKVTVGPAAGEVWYFGGDADTYKSTLLQRQAIIALNRGGRVHYFDVDNQFDTERFLTGIPARLKSRDTLENIVVYQNLHSLYDLYHQIYAILSDMKDEIAAYSKKNKVPPTSVVYARDIAPTLIIIDGISRLMSSDAVYKDIGESERTAAGNVDLHTFFTNIIPMVKFTGTNITISGHLRSRINPQFSWDDLKWWRTMQEYVQHAFKVSRKNKKEKTSGKIKSLYSWDIEWGVKKSKSTNHLAGVIGPVRFVVGHGFDVFNDCLNVMVRAGFMSDTVVAKDTGAVMIEAENKYGDKLPESLMEFVTLEVMTRAEWRKWMRQDGRVNRFVVGVMENLLKLKPMKIQDKREFADAVDSVLDAPAQSTKKA